MSVVRGSMSVRDRDVIFNIQIIMSGFSAEDKRSIEAPTVHKKLFSSLFHHYSKYRGSSLGLPKPMGRVSRWSMTGRWCSLLPFKWRCSSGILTSDFFSAIFLLSSLIFLSIFEIFEFFYKTTLLIFFLDFGCCSKRLNRRRGLLWMTLSRWILSRREDHFTESEK